jgi:hypothetical protein
MVVVFWLNNKVNNTNGTFAHENLRQFEIEIKYILITLEGKGAER